LSREFVEFARFNFIDNTRENLLGNGVGIHLETLGRLSDSL
jgi:hypothetical protein